MTTRNFDALFEPKAIALVGASNQPDTVGSVLARNLFETGFRGPIMPVNPHEQAIRSAVNYRTIAELPATPDLAVIATPPATVPGLIAELGARGCRAAVVATAGFGEGERAEGAALRQAMLDAARPHLLRIVGPNCLGVISPGVGINASFAQITPPVGDIAFVTQSGALAAAVLDWATARGIGFSRVVSLGDMADVDFGDMLDYLALDHATRAILLYVENVTHAKKFMSAGRIAARAKPVVVIKAGRSAAGAKAALSHTGALAGSDAVYDTAFRRAGMLRVYELRELFEAVTTLAAGLRPAGGRLAILTNGGGAGVLATDALEDYGGALAVLSPATIARLDAVLPATWSRGNPVDILGDAKGGRYKEALEALIADPGADAVLVMNCPTAVADSLEAARSVLDVVKTANRTPVLTCWLGEKAAEESRKLFAANRLPTYEMPNEAVRALAHLVDYRRNQDLLLETPPAGPGLRAAGVAAAHALVKTVLDEKRTVLTEPEAKELLALFDIPVVATLTARDPAEAAAMAKKIGGPVVLKILSPDIAHKSDVGGVRLDLRSPEAVEHAAKAILTTAAERAPKARITGFSVQAMVSRPQDHELIVGIGEDATFGPILLVGHGGTAVEVIGDRAIGLPPLNLVLAREMILRTRISKMLAGYRDRPPADIDAIAWTLVKLSDLLVALPEVAEIDINPLLAGPDGVMALDARVVVRPADAARRARFAIEPYPAELEHEIELGRKLLVRPIRPEDEPRLVEMVARSSPQDLRLRFLGALKEFPHLLAARLSQIDYDREMALVAVDRQPGAAQGEILGVSRIIADPDNERAEFAVMVRSDMKGRGLGFRLMQDILACARKRSIRTVHGDVLPENTNMLQMAAELGFKRERTDAGVVRVSIDL